MSEKKKTFSSNTMQNVIHDHIYILVTHRSSNISSIEKMKATIIIKINGCDNLTVIFINC